MDKESGVTADEKKTGTPPKRRGPRKESEIRAEIEAEAQAKIEALEAKLAALQEDEKKSSEEPAVLDAEQIRAQVRAEFEEEQRVKEAEAEKRRALAAEAKPISAHAVDGDPKVDGSLTVHFVEDGLTILGKVWYRGEELTINPDTDNWTEAHPVLSMDEYEQEERWGKRFFRPGVWRGKRIDEVDDPELTNEERAQLEKAAKAREARYGSLVN